MQSFFREVLLYHNSSLEFRAKVFTVVIAANTSHGACEEQRLKELAYSVYHDDSDRAEILIDTVKEYLHTIEDNTSERFNRFIAEIEHEVRVTPRFKKKIDLRALHTFRKCSQNFEDRLYQQRVFEFLKGVRQ